MSTKVPDGVRPGRRLGLLRVATDQALAAIQAKVGGQHPALRRAHLLIFRFGTIDGRHTSDLAAHAGMTKQSMHEIVTHLEKHGYLRRQPDPTDSRALLVQLTPRGRALERHILSAAAEVLESWRDRVGSRRFDAFWATLQEITGETGDLPDLAELRRAPSER
jgi:DNA-binding MarR family transcriptional regulator